MEPRVFVLACFPIYLERLSRLCFSMTAGYNVLIVEGENLAKAPDGN
jgi:hypothetical protein